MRCQSEAVESQYYTSRQVQYEAASRKGRGTEERRSATDRHDQEADTMRGRATCRVEEREIQCQVSNRQSGYWMNEEMSRRKEKKSMGKRKKRIVVRVRKRSGEKRRGENGGGRQSQ